MVRKYISWGQVQCYCTAAEHDHFDVIADVLSTVQSLDIIEYRGCHSVLGNNIHLEAFDYFMDTDPSLSNVLAIIYSYDVAMIYKLQLYYSNMEMDLHLRVSVRRIRAWWSHS